MRPEDGNRYKYVRRFLKEEFPGRALSRPGILDAAKACGELEAALFRRSLEWGQTIPPVVTPRKLDGLYGQYVYPDRWAIRGSASYDEEAMRSILVDVDLLEDFNQGKREVVLTKVGLVTLFEATVLHEMMHWGAFRDTRDDYRFAEEGFEFERRVYGQIVDV